jgi:hypothetical protein
MYRMLSYLLQHFCCGSVNMFTGQVPALEVVCEDLQKPKGQHRSTSTG